MVERGNFQILKKLSRLIINRFRWKPDGEARGGKKKVLDYGAKSVGEIRDFIPHCLGVRVHAVSISRRSSVDFGQFKRCPEYAR